MCINGVLQPNQGDMLLPHGCNVTWSEIANQKHDFRYTTICATKIAKSLILCRMLGLCKCMYWSNICMPLLTWERRTCIHSFIHSFNHTYTRLALLERLALTPFSFTLAFPWLSSSLPWVCFPLAFLQLWIKATLEIITTPYYWIQFKVMTVYYRLLVHYIALQCCHLNNVDQKQAISPGRDLRYRSVSHSDVARRRPPPGNFPARMLFSSVSTSPPTREA